MRIGVFDSGVGGLSVANAIKKALPEHKVIFQNDSVNVPYGLKTPHELTELVTPIIRGMIKKGCQVIVIACNTVTTTIIEDLRQRFPVPFVAIEPMIKPAAEQTKSKIIAVCATPATLASPRYAWLKDNFAKGIKVLEPDCSDWAAMIEEKRIDKAELDKRIKDVLDNKADIIVLACTHYHWIEDEVKSLAKNRAKVLQPEEATLRQLKRVLAQLP